MDGMRRCQVPARSRRTVLQTIGVSVAYDLVDGRYFYLRGCYAEPLFGIGFGCHGEPFDREVVKYPLVLGIVQILGPREADGRLGPKLLGLQRKLQHRAAPFAETEERTTLARRPQCALREAFRKQKSEGSVGR